MVVEDIVLFAEEYKAKKVIVKGRRMFFLVVNNKRILVAFFGLPLIDFELEYIVNELKRNGLEVEVQGDE